MIPRAVFYGCLLQLVAIGLSAVVIVAAWTFAPFLVDAARRALS